MKLLLIRHAVAEDQERFALSGMPDEQRPLTEAGREAMRQAASGLAHIVDRIDTLATSPLLRAQQTADVVGDFVKHDAREATGSMTPDAPYSEFIEWLTLKRTQQLVAAVGHNPHISGIACALMGARAEAIDMKKGSMLLLDLGDEIAEGKARLVWYLEPSQLRRLKDR